MSQRPHGYARYKLDGCRCYVCGFAVAQWRDAREQAVRRGRWQPYVDAAPVRAHLLRLRACGLGLRRIARASGVDRKRLQAVLNGRPERGTPPQRQVRPRLAQAVLAIEPTWDLLGPATVIDATGTRRRLQALVAGGWPQACLATLLHMPPGSITALLARERVCVRTARAVRALYDRLWCADPRGHGVGAQAYSRARHQARNRHWAPVGAWDDDTLDDPAAVSNIGDTRRLTRSERAAVRRDEIAHLASFGLSEHEIAARIGMPSAAVRTAVLALRTDRRRRRLCAGEPLPQALRTALPGRSGKRCNPHLAQAPVAARRRAAAAHTSQHPPRCERRPAVGIHLFIEVLDHAPDSLTWRERHVLSVLAENANDTTRECWPGIEDDPQLARRTRLTGRSSRYAVLKALREKKVLQTVAAGHRGHRAVYRIADLTPPIDPEPPGFAATEVSGARALHKAERVQERPQKRPQIQDASEPKASGNHGPSGAERVQERFRKGPHISDPFPSYPSSQPVGRDDPVCGIPAAARPLVESLTAAGVTVRWPFKGNEWFRVLALITKSGVQAMVEHAVKAAARARVDSARYFLPGWAELPPLPAVPYPSAPDVLTTAPPHCGALDCHPETRLREVEDDDGLPVLVPCHHCHPHTQGVQS
ncbi:hypothetical protein [Streptomyces rimosus]|uniref:hypothetical protein n=1 Tax=Streptomyces rimosus TaxID=1927 RepID=UPI0037AFAD3E